MDKDTIHARCNLCGKILDALDLDEDLTIHKERLGYGSIFDGDKAHLQLCCHCFDRLAKRCVISPIEYKQDLLPLS